MKTPAFATESAMCAKFLGDIDRKMWTPYAETAGWDILLVRNGDGFQIGIQAKLRMGFDVINQALEDGYHYYQDRPAPDCRAVMVPSGSGSEAFCKVCDFIGLTIIIVRALYGTGVQGAGFHPSLPVEARSYTTHDWHELMPAQRCKLPEYVPDVAAGASAPVQLTHWKISALRIVALLHMRGFVTRADFTALRIDHRRWTTPNGWLKPGDNGWVADRLPDFKAQHPIVYQQIVDDAEKWMPKHRQLI